MEGVLLPLGIAILLTVLFSGMEIAYLNADRQRAESDAQQGSLPARIFTFFVHHPAPFFTVTLVGFKLAIVLFAVYCGQAMEDILVNIGWISRDRTFFTLFWQTIVVTLVMVMLGELLIRALFRTGPVRLLRLLSVPFVIFYWLMYPFLKLLELLSGLFFGSKLLQQEQEITRQDLVHYIEETSATSQSDTAELDAEIFMNAMEFHAVRVRDCMIPRTEIAAVEVSEDLESVKRLFIDTGHSKLLVYRESIDNVIGYIHLVDLYRDPSSVDQMVMPIVVVPETMPVPDLMHKLLEKHRSIAVVVDEFGGTSGIVTMEDILEEIVGDIEDEHDVDILTEQKISDTEYIFSARQEIEYLNEEFGLALPEGDYDTLGGLIFFVHQNIPQQGDVISFPPFEFTILGMDQTRITEVRLRIIAEEKGD